MNYWLKNNLQLSVDKCLVKNKDSARQKAIKLVYLTSAFFILGTGIGFALSSFMIEVIYFHLQRRQPVKLLKSVLVYVISLDPPRPNVDIHQCLFSYCIVSLFLHASPQL